MNNFISNLAPLLNDFITFKNALDIKYKSSSHYLKKLDLYNYEHKNLSNLDRDTVEDWALKHAEKSVSRDRSWVSPIREFGRYLHSMGYEDAYIFDDHFVIRKYKAEVYLMSEIEIQRFFEECDRFVKEHSLKGRSSILPALYRFMYCCGVRCCETRSLKCENVHLADSYIDILHTKANKERRLYLSDELCKYLIEYNHIIEKSYPNREYFFPGTHGKLGSATLSSNFRKIWVAAGLKRDGSVKPRAYDFRHHFACANIMRWSSEGKDNHAMLPYLMRYMGHANLESTYYYIHLIPDFFPQYSNLVASTEDLIPEVDSYEV